MKELTPKQKRMEAFLVAGNLTLFRYGLLLALPLLGIWAAATLPLYGFGAELPRLAAGALLLTVLSGLGGPLLKLEYRVMSLPGVNQRLPINFAAVSLGLAGLLVLMADTEPQFLAMGRLVQITVLVAPAMVFVPALVFTFVHSMVIHYMVLRNSRVDFLYLVGSRQLAEKLEGPWSAAEEFGEPLSLMLLRLRPAEKNLALAAPNQSPPERELMLTTLNLVDRNIRKHDLADQYSADTVWVILGRTGPAHTDIPRDRIRNRLLSEPELAAALERHRLELAVGVVSYRREMKHPGELMKQAEEALRRS